MDQEIRRAFDSVTCDRQLKKRTRTYVTERMNRGRRFTPSRMKWTVSLACLLIFIGSGFGGYRLYYTEAATISIDINPSIELGLNRWGKVVEEITYGAESEKVLSSVSLKHLEYEEALERLLSSEALKKYLKKDSLVSITLENGNSDQQLLMNLQKCVDKTLEQCHNGVKAEYASVDEHLCQEAHNHGMSVGKYYAIQKLLTVDPQATVEEFKDKSMKEIKGHMEHCDHKNQQIQREDDQQYNGSGCGGQSGCRGGHHH